MSIKRIRGLSVLLVILLLTGCGLSDTPVPPGGGKVSSDTNLGYYALGLRVENGDLKESGAVFEDGPVAFQDPVIEEMLRTILGKPDGEVLRSELQSIHAIYWRSSNRYWSNLQSPDGKVPRDGSEWIVSGQPQTLADLAYCDNLQWLEIGAIELPPLEPLSSLTQLSHITFGNTTVSAERWEELVRLPALTGLELDFRDVSSISKAGTALFFAIPFGMVLARSFGLPNAFVISHYVAVLNSEAFQLAAGNTAAFLLLGVPTVLACALGIALLLYSRPPLGRLCSNTILLPLVLPLASIVLFLETLIPPQILEGPGAFWVLLGLYLWKNSGYLALLFLANLNMIPVELYQFAALEGADRRQQLFYITLPQLKSTFGFAGVIAVINNFRCYREAFLLGGKHPPESIYLMQHFLNNNFENLNFARLSVASVLSALPILIAAGAVAVFRRRFGDVE